LFMILRALETEATECRSNRQTGGHRRLLFSPITGG
jgi:hypothetical protein